MNALASLFRRGPQNAKAGELGDALRVAEAERQTLREREQALAVKRQDALMGGDDDELDAIEAELATVQRAAERHDARIPELRRMHAERQTSEQRAADRAAFEEAVAQRLAIAEQIDATLARLGGLFGALDATGATLRGLDAYHGASRKVSGPMGEMRLDREALGMTLLHHVPTVGRALGVHQVGGQRPESFHAYEARVWSRLTVGPEPAAMAPQAPMPSAGDLASADEARALANRGL